MAKRRSILHVCKDSRSPSSETEISDKDSSSKSDSTVRVLRPRKYLTTQIFRPVTTPKSSRSKHDDGASKKRVHETRKSKIETVVCDELTGDNEDTNMTYPSEDDPIVIRKKRCSSNIVVSSSKSEEFDSIYERVKRRKRKTERTTENYYRNDLEESNGADNKKYYLRQRAPVVRVKTGYENGSKHTTNGRSSRCVKRRRRSRGCLSFISSGTETSENDSDEELFGDMFQKQPVKKKTYKKARLDSFSCEPINSGNVGVSFSLFKQSTGRDVDMMHLDKDVTFESIGGVDKNIQTLKEMIIFPLLYPQVFQRFHIQPPRGVLFHGLPGTGKTLLARALANECSMGPRKVSFFMRKGADCLSKWVGESERQLRTVFDKAYAMRPSIIFFDEIDGLAPIRSSRQDHIHSSIVSTLLALMDGLDDRSEIVIIGATNRIDAIDPALRRPGRFDREFFFRLPDYEARTEILRIHTRKWDPPLPDEQIKDLAEKTNGFCGADLQAFCRDSVLTSLRRTFPQIYSSKQRLSLNPKEIAILPCDFEKVLKTLVPATSRSSCVYSRPLPTELRPLLVNQRDAIYNSILKLHPCLKSTDDRHATAHPSLYRPRVIVCGSVDPELSNYIAPSILHMLELTVYTCDLVTLYDKKFNSIEEACANIFREATRNYPCVLYMPHINTWWSSLPQTVQIIILTSLRTMPSSLPVLLFVTADIDFDELSDDIKNLFEQDTEVYLVRKFDANERRSFFEQSIAKDAFTFEPLIPADETVLSNHNEEQVENLTTEDLENVHKEEERVFRTLRMFLREVLSRVTHDRRFNTFKGAVDPENVPDYYDIVKSPIDLSMIMGKIDGRHYFTVDQFLDDVRLLTTNAMHYNPDASATDREIRHKACGLYDITKALIDLELDRDAHETVISMFENRLARGAIRRVPCKYMLYRTPNRVPFIRFIPVIDKKELRYQRNEFLPDGVDEDEYYDKFELLLTIPGHSKGAHIYVETIPPSPPKESKKLETVRKRYITPNGKTTHKNVLDSPTSKTLRKCANELINNLVGKSEEWSVFKFQKFHAKLSLVMHRHIHVADKSELFREFELLASEE